ncbi:MAG: Flp pilus assembly complex ATPase component TadA [Ottowia sp.]|nr:Flp pilus assembly complex ATPase component TadA [Ottowia sp.]
MVGDLLPVPNGMAEKLAINHAEKSVYVDSNTYSAPLFRTWLDRNKSNGISLNVVKKEMDEIATMRNNGMRVTSDIDSDMVVRGQAIDMISQAARYNASDIHMMMRGTYTEIQTVVKGKLRVLARKSQAEGEALARAIYQGLAKTRDASWNPLDFQNAQISGDALPVELGLTSLRIIRGPCYPQASDGSFMTLRLQYSSTLAIKPGVNLRALELPRKPAGELQLQRMGFSEKQIAKLKVLMDAPNGIVIITGPTGCGKTTTLFEVLQDLARSKPHRRQVTAEDPVEYPMEWAVQMAVTDTKNDTETGDAFGERIRTALRMAPHIILLGELRGPTVAVAALEAAVTGHQVWTTLHVTDPFLFVERLELMDTVKLNRRVFCDHKIVRGVIAQRLLPTLCPHCSIALRDRPEALPQRMVSALKTWEDISAVRVKGNGCEHCDEDGTVGRSAVVEVVVSDATLMRDFIEHGSETARRNYRTREDADPSMLASAIEQALAGLVDPIEIEECVDLIEAKDVKGSHVFD